MFAFNRKLKQKTISALPDYTMSSIQQFLCVHRGRVYVVIVSIYTRYFIGTQDLAPWCVRVTQELVVIRRHCHIYVSILDFVYEITCTAILAYKPFGVFSVTNQHLYFLLGDNYEMCKHLAMCFSTVSLCAQLYHHDNQRVGWRKKVGQEGTGKVTRSGQFYIIVCDPAK